MSEFWLSGEIYVQHDFNGKFWRNWSYSCIYKCVFLFKIHEFNYIKIKFWTGQIAQ